jgi:hypothetical protein
VVPSASQFNAVADQIRKIQFRAYSAALLVPNFAGFQNLLDGSEQPIGIEQHEAIKVTALTLADLATLQSFEVQTYRCDGRFQFVCDRVDKTVVLFVPLYFSHQEACVDDHAADNRSEEDYSDEKENSFPPVENNPANVQDNGEGNETDSQYKEKGNRFSAAGDEHGR